MDREFGILTASRQDGRIGGNQRNFMRICKEAARQAAICRVFNVDAAENVYAYALDETSGRFQRIDSDVPRVLYNRIPTRPLERQRAVADTLRRLAETGHVITNPHFLRKDTLLERWLASPMVQPYVPVTQRLTSFAVFQSFLKQHQAAYLKPVSGRAGVGIIYIRSLPGGRLSVARQKAGRAEIMGSMSDATVYAELDVKHGKPRYILQEDAQPIRFKGRRFDLRTLLHRGDDGHFQVTGVGVRLASSSGFTTHVPNGGRIMPVDEVLQPLFGTHSDAIRQRAMRAAVYAADAVTSFPGVWCELSVDIGVRQDGQPVLYEANAKPMKFDEPEIERQAKMRLVHCLTRL